ncbi:hypothetical protein B0H19DRAFT_1112590 [Mycena capillaripes]|nr:hypothetical protein B0H19DRAFT_1112590 [Mycena capillaripes]
MAQRLEITKTWLGRSGQCPLSISLQSSVGYSPDTPPVSPSISDLRRDEFLQALITFAPRWQHICFTISPSMLESMMHLTANDVPMLESIAFQVQQQRFLLSP